MSGRADPNAAALPLALCAALGMAVGIAAYARAAEQAPLEPRGRITIIVSGVDAAQGGQLLVSLFRGADSWLEERRARRSVAIAIGERVGAGGGGTGSQVVVVFPDVLYGSDYAVRVIHDRNGNGELDFRWFPYPKLLEGAGISNNHERMGPPLFDEARFSVEQPELALTVIVRY